MTLYIGEVKYDDFEQVLINADFDFEINWNCHKIQHYILNFVPELKVGKQIGNLADYYQVKKMNEKEKIERITKREYGEQFGASLWIYQSENDITTKKVDGGTRITTSDFDVIVLDDSDEYE